MMGFGHGWRIGRFGMHGFWGGMIMIIFWVLIIIGIIYLVKNFNNNSQNDNENKHYSRKEEDDALNIVRKRYARGEISKEEYEKIVEDLKENI